MSTHVDFYKIIVDNEDIQIKEITNMSSNTAIVFEATREGYGLDQVSSPMTVGDLINILQDFDPDTKIFLSHDGGYTYGTIPEDFEERDLDQEEE